MICAPYAINIKLAWLPNWHGIVKKMCNTLVAIEMSILIVILMFQVQEYCAFCEVKLYTEKLH